MGLFRRKKNKKELNKDVAFAENRISSFSDKGRRENQEDFYLISKKFEDKQLFLVADGVGGMDYGEFASKQVIEVFDNFFFQMSNFETPAVFLSRTAFVAASMISNKANDDPGYANCGTTLTGFLIDGDKYYTINIGDSRVYKFANNKLQRKTKDHSLVQYFIDNNIIKPEEAFTHPKKNIISSMISKDVQKMKVDVDGPFDLCKGDILIACSDGVHDAMRDEEIQKIISENINSDNLAKIIVQAAYNAGSKDNITVCSFIYHNTLC